MKTNADTPSKLQDARQERFCLEYMVDLHGTKAAIRAGYSAKGASVQASRLMARANVKARIEFLQAKFAERNDITVDRILEEYAKIGFFDPRQLFDATGAMIPIADLPAEVRAGISSIDVEENWSGAGENKRWTGTVKKIRLCDKKTALDSMARHLGMFKDTLDVRFNPLKELYDRIGQKGCQLKPVP